MSVRISIIGDPTLVESVIAKLRSRPRMYDLLEFERAYVPEASWFICCFNAPQAIDSPVARTTVYLPVKGVVITSQYNHVHKISEILPHMIAGSLGPTDSLQVIINEAREALAYHALWAFGMLTIISAFSASEYSDSVIAIMLDCLLLACWIWYAVDMVCSGLRVFRGQILDSPSLQKNNGVLQRIFVMLVARNQSLFTL